MKEVVVTGATGFIGRQVLKELCRRGWSTIGISRDPKRAAATGSGPPASRWLSWEDAVFEPELARAGKCIHLAGQHPFERRWSQRYKAEMRESRIATTERIVGVLGSSSASDRVLISTSGTGIYGDCGDEPFGEEHRRGSPSFLSDMEADWEAQATSAQGAGVRVAVMRVGISLGREGGALAILERNFQRGMGGHAGSGRQYVPWIHNVDCARMYVEALERSTWSGIFNCTAPAPRTFAELCTALGSHLGRRSWFHAPPVLLRLMIGEASTILLESQRALPQRAQLLGFRYEHGRLESAVAELFTSPAGGRSALAGEATS